jgi:hypothetical protein
MDWARQKCSSCYDSSWRWVEDTYLSYFGENRTSYGIKESLKNTEITGDENVDRIQSGVGGAVGDVFSSKGPAGIVGDGVDKGVLRGKV